MNKYNLIHTITGEKHLCDKVVIDDDEYYVTSTDNIQTGDWVYSEDLNSIEKVKELFTCLRTEHEINVPAAYLENRPSMFVELPRCKKVIATSNPDTLIPCIFDVIEDSADLSYSHYNMNLSYSEWPMRDDYVKAYKNGYFKSFVTHPFSAHDMIDFANYVRILDTVTASEALASYIEQKPTTLYYE